MPARHGDAVCRQRIICVNNIIRCCRSDRIRCVHGVKSNNIIRTPLSLLLAAGRQQQVDACVGGGDAGGRAEGEVRGHRVHGRPDDGRVRRQRAQQGDDLIHSVLIAQPNPYRVHGRPNDGRERRQRAQQGKSRQFEGKL